MDSLYQLAIQTQERGDLAGAEGLYRQVIAGMPGHGEARLKLGVVVYLQGREEEARGILEEALRWVPAEATLAGTICGNLGVIYRGLGWLDLAEESYRQALVTLPRMAMVWNNLAEVCFLGGRVEEAIEHLDRARGMGPLHPMLASNRIFFLQYHPGMAAATDASVQTGSIGGTPMARATEAALAEWQQAFAEPHRQAAQQPHGNERSAERRLRVGYVSPDFRDHCQSLFMLPLLAFHDASQVEVVGYSDWGQPNGVTAAIRGRCHGWRETAGWSDEQLAEVIRGDQIDVLVDLTMHMAGNRLQVFARKPAPVQVTWLAYPGTTGLAAMDYRLSDPYLDPAGADETGYAEKTWRLPATFWCYDPLEAHPPEAGPPPALRGRAGTGGGGAVTFGCLNNSCKVNEVTLGLWARVLRALPDARLLMLVNEGLQRVRTRQTLAQLGIAPERLLFESRRLRPDYLRLFQEIDIGLDTLPYNGHTTSLDSYFMGVPVVTLVGPTIVGCAGYSQLTNLGLPELIAWTPEEYVRIATELAGDLGRLAKMRAGLRERMRASPLMDAAGFARGMEGAYRGMWRACCEGRDATRPEATR